MRVTWWRIWRGSKSIGVCRYCRGAIVWGTTDAGKSVPLNPHETPTKIEIHPRTRAQFEVYSSASLHFSTCPRRPARNSPR